MLIIDTMHSPICHINIGMTLMGLTFGLEIGPELS